MACQELVSYAIDSVFLPICLSDLSGRYMPFAEGEAARTLRPNRLVSFFNNTGDMLHVH